MPSRFSLSFPGRRGRDDPWFRIGAVDVNTSLLVAIMCAISLFVWAASKDALAHLLLFPDEIKNGQIWRIITWPLYNEPSLWTVISIAMLWYFGKELERTVGRVKYAVLILLLAVVPGLVAFAVDTAVGGIRFLEIAVFCLFIAEYPNVRFFFNIPAWVLGVVVVGVEVLVDLGNRDTELLLILFASLATAAIAGKAMGLLSEVQWVPKVAGNGGSSGRSSRRRQVGGRAGRGTSRDFDRVVSGPWAGSTTDADHAEMDRLLDKMNSVGLSDAERKRLTELGRKLRGS